MGPFWVNRIETVGNVSLGFVKVEATDEIPDRIPAGSNCPFRPGLAPVF